ncbi:MAG: hypothetical protein K2X00_15870 [Nitrospiraceae bacterium]|nr:hypothetical protein [Nitrospiraceae bacterium]
MSLAGTRARVRDVIEMARERSAVVLLAKYHDGAWAEPELGGSSSSLLAGNGELLWGDVSYNVYLSCISIASGPLWPATDLNPRMVYSGCTIAELVAMWCVSFM